MADGIYHSEMTPEECIDKLEELGVSDDADIIGKLETTGHRYCLNGKSNCTCSVTA